MITLRAVLLYAGRDGGGLSLRVIVWNNNVPATAITFNYAGQVLPVPSIFHLTLTACPQVVNDVPRGKAVKEEEEEEEGGGSWDEHDDMGCGEMHLRM